MVKTDAKKADTEQPMGMNTERRNAARVPTDKLRAVLIDAVERRVSPRAEFELSVGVATDHRLFVGLAADISAGGLFIATDEKLQRGDHVEVRFSIPGSHHVFQKRAVVRWIRPISDADENAGSKAGVGVQLEDLTPDEAKILNAFLKMHEPIFYDS
jgi:uncharacterized protein (TIGR02266 family)